MKILMLIDSLEIGGAETHVETLALSLLERGHTVTVASRGGAVAERLGARGIKLLTLPDISGRQDKNGIARSPLDVFGRGYFSFSRSRRRKLEARLSPPLRLMLAGELIARYVRRERPDIVHAHTRRTAFLASSVCKRLKIPLVTTAHARFSMDFPKNVLSKWGDGVIAVSEDIKSHVLAGSRVRSGLPTVRVIPNGVRIKRDEGNVTEGVCRPYRIVFVSRLDADCSIGAHLLCDIALRLAKRYDGIEMILVGGGTEYPSIAKTADMINQKINCRLINTVGGVDDPSVFFNEGALFVGVSRAALEAMACGLAVILLGNEGYLGLLDEGKLEAARASNFTCRKADVSFLADAALKDRKNTEYRANAGNEGSILPRIPSPDELFDEICRYFELRDAEKKGLSELSSKAAAEGHSADKMADETVGFYKDVISKYNNCCGDGAERKLRSTRPDGLKIVICGYYGRGNFGDEAILCAILGAIKRAARERGLACSRGSADDGTRAQRELEVHILCGKDPFKLARALRGADLFIFGGGSLLQNSTSTASLLWYIRLIALARARCSKTVMLANGIGPITDGALPREILLKSVARAVESFDLISVRDGISKAKLQALLPRRKIYRIPDPTLAFFLADTSNINQRLIKSDNVSVKKRFFLFCPCARGAKKRGITPEMIAASLGELEMRELAECAMLVLNENEDMDLARRVAELMGGARIFAPKAMAELCAVLRRSAFTVSQRYHGALLSIACRVPTAAISDDPKMQALCAEFGILPSQKTDILRDAESLCGHISNVLSDHAKNHRALAERVDEECRRADRALGAVLKKFIL